MTNAQLALLCSVLWQVSVPSTARTRIIIAGMWLLVYFIGEYS